MTIQKKHLNNLLLNLLYFHKNEKGEEFAAGGLLMELMTLGTKRRLQKIRKELIEHAKTLSEDEKQVRKEATDLEAELKALFDEEVKLTSEPVKMCEIEKIETEKNYDFDLIELITEKCNG